MTISDETLMAYADGELDAAARAAGGPLERPLTIHPAGDHPGGAAVQMVLSSRAKPGGSCRPFALGGGVSPSGLACRRGEGGQVQALPQKPGAADVSGYRTAAST